VTDNITLPREVVEKIREAWSSEVYPPAASIEWYDIMDALRAALVAAHREAQSIHTCPPDCQKPLCVNRRREIEAAVEAEREAICKLADNLLRTSDAVALIDAIRARGSK
jgi:hypothetical protein